MLDSADAAFSPLWPTKVEPWVIIQGLGFWGLGREGLGF